MQELTSQAARIATPSVHRVANDREMRVREMDADLMRPAGDRTDVKERDRGVPERPGGDPPKARRRLTARRPHHHAAAVVGITLERRLHDRLLIAGIAPDQCEVFLRETLSLKLTAERELRDVV